MGKKEKTYRECQECGGPIESGNPAVQLCKRCATKLQNKRHRDGSRHRPKEKRKKKGTREEEYYEEEFG